DARLRVERQARLGLTRSLNRALGLARGALVARLDADDLAVPERVARQRAFLDGHPDVGLLGTGAREVDAAGREVAVVVPPADDRLRAEGRLRWRAVRSGAYPPWCALFALRPWLALALPPGVRRTLRRART